MNKLPFKKGDRAITYTDDRRERQINQVVVVSAGEKYITVQDAGPNGEPWGRKEQYSTSTRMLKDYLSRKLYHDENELNEELEARKLRIEFEGLATRLGFTNDEIKLFMEIHKMGIDKFQETYFKRICF